MGLLPTRNRGYTFSRNHQKGHNSLTSSLTGTQLYAQVALDISVKDIASQLFTYEIPEHLRAEVFVGSQVLVPFGHQDLVSGYVVGIGSRSEIIKNGGNDEAASQFPDKTKSISDVLDSGSIFKPQYIEFLYWIAEYYMCSISDVLNAAIPAEIGPRIKRMVRLIDDSDDTAAILQIVASPAANEPADKIKLVLKEAAKSVSLKTLKQRSALPNKVFYSTLAKMRRKGELEIFGEAEDAPGPKLVNHVVWTGAEAKTKRQEEIVAQLKRHNGSLPLNALIEATKSTSATIKRMVNEGILSINQIDTFRDPLKNYERQERARPQLTEKQSQVLSLLSAELRRKLEMNPDGQMLESASNQTPVSDQRDNSYDEVPWLLHGVTGSGKTEIYLRLIEETMSLGRAALLLVPEISLTPQLAQRLLERFGEQVAIWHSALSAGERFDTWRRVQSGELRLVLGARSAVLANIPELGLIILDEEHDGSYKQSTPSPRYSARHLACQRGIRESCFVLFGSATPDSGTYFEAKKAGKIVELPERVFKQALPSSMLVDMRTEFLAGNKSIISRTLQEELAGCLERQEQAILLINRRGYASHIFCRACGDVLMCKHCSVSLVYHSSRAFDDKSNDEISASGRLSCHHCGFTQGSVDTCPSCNSPFLKQGGLGTQRVESETRELFPDARILRLDSDITSRKGAYEDVFKKFSAAEADILIGTQIVAKGLDIARVSLVGVLAADAAFNLPDFRSLERGFQLLTQVSGRAGRADIAGRVILQTHNTELPALLLSKDQDYHSFIQQELESRERFEYPPYCRLLRILASGPDAFQVQSELERLAEQFSNFIEDIEQITILGPAPCLIERIKGQYRFHIIIKNLMGDLGHKIIASFLRGRSSPASVRIIIDVDPVDLI